MIGEPRDRSAYAMSIATLGLALAIAIAAIAWITTEHGSTTTAVGQECVTALKDCKSVEITERDASHALDGLWIVAAAIGGVFVGALIPFSLRLKPRYLDEDGCGTKRFPWAGAVEAALIGIFGVTALILGRANHDSLTFYALGSVLVGLLLGLFVPSPGYQE